MDTSDTHEALFGCNHLGCITMMPVASCLPFPFFAPCDNMLTMFVYATCWPSMHLYTLAHISMHESCLLVRRPYFNIMKLWTSDSNLRTSDSNLHLFLVDTTFCLPSCFFVCLFIFACHVSHHMLCLPYLSCLVAFAPFCTLSTHLFLSIVCLLVFSLLPLHVHT